ncbi:MAG: hypothetical protein AB7G28_03055 [Pirellulales bacterium]
MRTLCSFLAACVLLGLVTRPAAAVLQFYKVWEEEYLTNHPDQEYAKLVKKPANRCFVCHVGKNRKHRNEYGKLMEADLDPRKDTKNKEKILEVIKKASEGKFDDSTTFAQRIEASKFPAGELEDLKKEPAE